ncbi:hypothetical protein BLNAU_110 [Blattamonas nauphoetae]|uniref:ATP-dependent RNA helicase n=1 Tax=Blattamonas nauphoetae TaxID=2049346 RepID=A0ABQ9YM27_9EUKA|nr:hypothetical protein BLNAU_110 [Blattamonas nauphoetae]
MEQILPERLRSSSSFLSVDSTVTSDLSIAASCIPIIEYLLQHRPKREGRIHSVIFCENRDLVVKADALLNVLIDAQTLKKTREDISFDVSYDDFENLASQYIPTHSIAVEGANRTWEAQRITSGVDILVTTPHRFIDHVLHTPGVSVKHCRATSLILPDNILPSFYEAIEQLLTFLPSNDKRFNVVVGSSSFSDTLPTHLLEQLHSEDPTAKGRSMKSNAELRNMTIDLFCHSVQRVSTIEEICTVTHPASQELLKMLSVDDKASIPPLSSQIDLHYSILPVDKRFPSFLHFSANRAETNTTQHPLSIIAFCRTAAVAQFYAEVVQVSPEPLGLPVLTQVFNTSSSLQLKERREAAQQFALEAAGKKRKTPLNILFVDELGCEDAVRSVLSMASEKRNVKCVDWFILLDTPLKPFNLSQILSSTSCLSRTPNFKTMLFVLQQELEAFKPALSHKSPTKEYAYTPHLINSHLPSSATFLTTLSSLTSTHYSLYIASYEAYRSFIHSYQTRLTSIAGHSIDGTKRKGHEWALTSPGWSESVRMRKDQDKDAPVAGFEPVTKVGLVKIANSFGIEHPPRLDLEMDGMAQGYMKRGKKSVDNEEVIKQARIEKEKQKLNKEKTKSKEPKHKKEILEEEEDESIVKRKRTHSDEGDAKKRKKLKNKK